MQKGFFLDRDGVINRERGDYTYRVEDFEIIDGVKEALTELQKQGYKCIVITNQAGISKGLYTVEDMNRCHAYMNSELPGLIDDVFYSPYHPTVTESISRKPSTLMFQRAIAKFKIDPKQSWMIGDREKDLIPAKELSIQTAIVKPDESLYADIAVDNLWNAVSKIL